MERFADPKILETMSLAEKAGQSALVMLLGVGIVFTVLLLLLVSMKVMSVLLRQKDKQDE